LGTTIKTVRKGGARIEGKILETKEFSRPLNEALTGERGGNEQKDLMMVSDSN